MQVPPLQQTEGMLVHWWQQAAWADLARLTPERTRRTAMTQAQPHGHQQGLSASCRVGGLPTESLEAVRSLCQ